ncbi:MAG: gamma-glutamylcyclotransferase family protein [Polaromonas sp.]|nr:gamma-glutamylcyclotransferase family protein [Polaromonas sp.]
MSASSLHVAAHSPGHVFVYGTLRRGDVRDINRLQPTPRFVANATVKGTLYHLGSYPGLVLEGQVLVQGEVYAIEPALERLLDEIEEVWPQQTGEYIKRVIPVEMEGGQTLDCIVYEISPARLDGTARIDNGDWLSVSR